MQNIKSPQLSQDENTHEHIFLARLAAAIASRDEFDAIVRALAPQLVTRWAGKNILKKAVAGLVAKSIQKGFSPENTFPVMENLISEPEFAKAAMQELPVLVSGIVHAIADVAARVSALPQEDKEKLASDFLKGVDGAAFADLMNAGLHIVNEIRTVNPQFFSENLTPLFSSFIGRVDFGELKEAVENSAGDIESLVKNINEELWKYPAKVICILGLIPSGINILVRSLKESIAPINKLAPDLLVDVLLSVLNEIDFSRMGLLANELYELVRKLHTGSALLGEPGKPQLPRVVEKLLNDFLETMDSSAFLRMTELVGDMKNMMSSALFDAVENRPELIRGILRAKFRTAALRIRRLLREIELIKSAMQEAGNCDDLADGISEIDMQEFASMIDTFVSLFNMIHEERPDLVRDAASQFFSSLDQYEASRAVAHVVSDLVAALRPIAPEVMPPLLRGFAELISEEEGNEEMADAIERLRHALLGKEVSR